MSNFSDQPLPPGVQSYTRYSSVPSAPVPFSSHHPHVGNPPHPQFQWSNTQTFYQHAMAPQYNIGPNTPVVMGQNPENTTLNGGITLCDTANPSEVACKLGRDDSSNLQDAVGAGTDNADQVGHDHQLNANKGDTADPSPPSFDKHQLHELCRKTEQFVANSGGNCQSISSDIHKLHKQIDSASAAGILPSSVNKHVENASDIECAAQDAVLREQVCPFFLERFSL